MEVSQAFESANKGLELALNSPVTHLIEIAAAVVFLIVALRDPNQRDLLVWHFHHKVVRKITKKGDETMVIEEIADDEEGIA